jgi:formiminotetrahydrofolate cyclodeaminase
MDETYLKGSIDRYLSELSGRSITPGGGSAAALTAALGAGLNLMVLNYSAKVGQDTRDDISKVSGFRERQEKSLKKLSSLIDEDCKAFKDLMNVLSSGKDAQAKYRAAALVPLDVCGECRVSMEVTAFLSESGNKNLITDVGGAADTLKAAFNSARLNAEINLNEINDRAFVEDAVKMLSETAESIDREYKKVQSRVGDIMRKKGSK